MNVSRTLVCVAIAWGCGDDPARVSLVPVGAGPCGRPSGATGLKVTAYGPTGEVTRAVALDGPISIADFPDTTTQLGVEVLVGNGAIGAAGKTAPLAFGALADGVVIPIAMAPLGGFCPVGAMIEARRAPLVARAGDAVLVAGGTGPAGPLSTAELYDPATAMFQPIEVPDAIRDPVEGLAGAVLTPLADGRVVLTGGVRGVLTVFDPTTRTFGPVLVINRRAFHAAVALDGDRVLVTGGCANVVGQTCDAMPLRSTLVYALDGVQDGGPNLPPTATHEGAQLFDLGIDGDGVQRAVLAGGFGDPGVAARFAVDDAVATPLAGLAAQAIALDGGAVFTAFARDGEVAAGPVAVIPPDGAPVTPLAAAPALAGARLVALEDGSAIAIGGDPLGGLLRYSPTADAWVREVPDGDTPGAAVAPTLVRLADGSVLVLSTVLAPSNAAWLYRPSLVGPESGTVTVLPSAAPGGPVLTVPDPRTVTRDAGWVLTSTDDRLRARALVGGPRLAAGTISATVHAVAGGFAFVAQQRGAGHAVVAELAAGMPARLVQLDGARTLCTGMLVELPPGPISASLELAASSARVVVNGKTVLACDVALRESGSWGIAALGAGGRVTVDVVTVTR